MKMTLSLRKGGPAAFVSILMSHYDYSINWNLFGLGIL